MMSDLQDASAGARVRAVGPIDTSPIAVALKRAASLNTGFPTRTIRITAVEQSSRDNTPNPITIEGLVNRPRSNPRVRTPMRYESPLESDAFRNVPPSEESRRITIRPSAGAAVGSIAQRAAHSESTAPKGKSTKQGPSQRKLRRWRNEHFPGLAAELTSSRAADVWRQAHRDAHLYRSVYDPLREDQGRSEAVHRYVHYDLRSARFAIVLSLLHSVVALFSFMTEDGLQEARERFFEGHGPAPTAPPHATPVQKNAATGDEMLHRLDPRLRRLVVRACHNSYAAAKVVQLFETFVVGSFTSRRSPRLPEEDDRWWTSLLLERPTITRRKDSDRCTAQFFFDATVPTAGFHRLLLHAVCQFHGLNVVSRMENNYVIQNQETSARALVATGNIDDSAPRILLLEHLGEVIDDPDCVESPTAMVDQMAKLRV